MLPLPHWLARHAPDSPALLLPGRTLSYGEARRWPGTSGLSAPAGGAADKALALLAAGLGGGTVFPLPPDLAPEDRGRLLALAEAAASPRLALIVATSGSEGEPKGVRLPWRAVAAAARLGAAAELRPGDTWLACLPLHHVGGAMIPYRCWRAGAAALIHEGFDAAAVLRDLRERRVSHVSLVPPMLARLVDGGERPPASLRVALVGGAALSAALFDKAAALGWPLCPTYGMTETGAQATLWLRPRPGEWSEGAVGRPLPGVRVEADGVLRIRTPARMAGYLGGPPAGEWIETRDLGRVDADGMVHAAGRADDVLVSGGVNIHPLEVEHRLAACPGVREAAVAGCPDPVWGDVVAAFYEGDAAEAEVEAWCRLHLSSSRRPRRFLRVAGLPRTASGKLDRRRLAQLMAEAAP